MHCRNNQGFTLLEVLIALTILSIALTAIIKSTSQHVKDTAYLQQKSVATWIGLKVINEARVHLLSLPQAPDVLEEATDMLGEHWLWKAWLTKTPNANIQEINVDVFYKKEDAKLIHLTGYLYHG